MRKTISPRTTIINMIIEHENRIDKETILSKMKLEHNYCFDDTNAILNELRYGGILYIGKYVEIQKNWEKSDYAKKNFDTTLTKEDFKKLFHNIRYRQFADY